ncbi:hypothetical protein GQ53DRAFT_875096 [Thozetella sp. PMI_491]|nr:hypothetical protein GQ53DRAFT_875096 [Thozetella sp. PMI_491]
MSNITQDALADAISQAILSPPNDNAVEMLAFAAFIEQVFYLLLIQSSDDIFNMAFNMFISPAEVSDINNNNNTKLSFDGFKRVIANIRKSLGGRRLISSKVVPAPTLPGDSNPSTSTSGHLAVFEGIDSTGTIVTVNFFAVGSAAKNPDGSSQLAVEKMVLTRNLMI